jgi:hypothetical protein
LISGHRPPDPSKLARHTPPAQGKANESHPYSQYGIALPEFHHCLSDCQLRDVRACDQMVDLRGFLARLEKAVKGTDHDMSMLEKFGYPKAISAR